MLTKTTVLALAVRFFSQGFCSGGWEVGERFLIRLQGLAYPESVLIHFRIPFAVAGS